MQHHLPTSYLLQNRYLITRKIGQGGFGITYEAIDRELNKRVCIKELFIEGINQRVNQNVTLTEGKKEFSWTYFIANFKKEAQKIAEFSHPSIVSVSSVFETNGTAYYVMEYVEGENLKEYLHRLGRPFTEEEIKPIAIQIFDAVDTVHSKGLLHRDIKPDNFLIRANKQIVLIDFGSSRENMDDKTVALLASTTILMLTHGYSAPEMYSNLSVKGRFTDIYSLGATLYYLLSLKKPMPANDRQFAKMPALHEVNPNVSSQLSSAVMTAMEMKEGDRFQMVGDFRSALQQMAAGQKKKEEKTVVVPEMVNKKIKDRPVKGKKNNRLVVFSITGLLVLLLLILALWSNNQHVQLSQENVSQQKDTVAIDNTRVDSTVTVPVDPNVIALTDAEINQKQKEVPNLFVIINEAYNKNLHADDYNDPKLIALLNELERKYQIPTSNDVNDGNIAILIRDLLNKGYSKHAKSSTFSLSDNRRINLIQNILRKNSADAIKEMDGILQKIRTKRGG